MPEETRALTAESALARLSRLDAQLRIEFDLIGHRITWLIVAHSLLFSGFATTLNNALPQWTVIINTLVWLIPGLGIYTSLFVGLAVHAAHSAIDEIKGIREFLQSEIRSAGYPIEDINISPKDWRHHAGRLAPVALVWGFGFAWLGLMIEVLTTR